MSDLDLLITNARLWERPEAALRPDCFVSVAQGRVVDVGAMSERPGTVSVTQVLDVGGRVVTAGFWNCHIHLTERVWSGAARAEAEPLQSALNDMLVSRGFTNVVDLASNSRNTLPLRSRIAAGELTGPTIRTATEAVYPARGLPFYTRGLVPWFARWALPTPWTPVGAGYTARRQLHRGADVIKLFTGSYVERDRIKVMRPQVAAAAVKVAHRDGALVFAHTSNRAGLQVAFEAGVDVIAHVPSETEGIDDLLLACAAAGIRMVPTLHMFAHTVTTSRDFLDPIADALRTFVQAGGRLLFGTDVGYMDDYDTTGELDALSECGLSAADMLRMLTTEPAAAFGCSQEGAVAPGMTADLAVLDTTRQALQPSDFSSIWGVIKDGNEILSSDQPVTLP